MKTRISTELLSAVAQTANIRWSASQEQTDNYAEDEPATWTDAERLWPCPKKVVDRSIPKDIRLPLQEADLCLSARAFNACVVMCGRAIEALCANQTTERTTFFEALRKLREMNVIDGRLFEWGNALRQLRNLGAHATDKPMSKEDAADAVDFAHAIVDYVCTLSERFNKFMARRGGASSSAARREEKAPGTSIGSEGEGL